MSEKKTMLRHAAYCGSAEVSIEDGCMHGRILHIDDIVTYEGETVPQLRAEFVAAVDRYLAHCKSIGKSPNRPYSGSLNVRLGPELHRSAAEYGAEHALNINETICRAVAALVSPEQPASTIHLHPVIIRHEPVRVAPAGSSYPHFEAIKVDREISAQTAPSEPKMLLLQ